MKRLFLLPFLFLTLLLLSTVSGCGGRTAAAPPAVTLSISPSAATRSAGATQQFTATVTGTSETAVTWCYRMHGDSQREHQHRRAYTQPHRLSKRGDSRGIQAASISSQSPNLGAGITLLPARTDVLAMHSYAAVAEKKP
jgi:hypothetical protein